MKSGTDKLTSQGFFYCNKCTGHFKSANVKRKFSSRSNVRATKVFLVNFLVFQRVWGFVKHRFSILMQLRVSNNKMWDKQLLGWMLFCVMNIFPSSIYCNICAQGRIGLSVHNTKVHQLDIDIFSLIWLIFVLFRRLFRAHSIEKSRKTKCFFIDKLRAREQFRVDKWISRNVQRVAHY